MNNTSLNPNAPPFIPNSYLYGQMSQESRKNINIGHLNINRLLHKTHHVRDILLKCSLSILAITETWLTDEISDGEVAMDGYRLFRRDRRTGHQGGGVCVYVHHQLNVRVLNKLDHPDLEMLWLEVKLGKERFNLGCLYRPPSTPVGFWTSLENFTEELQGQQVMLLGDFNVNSLDSAENQQRHLNSFCSTLGLKEMVQSQQGQLQNQQNASTSFLLTSLQYRNHWCHTLISRITVWYHQLFSFLVKNCSLGTVPPTPGAAGLRTSQTLALVKRWKST